MPPSRAAFLFAAQLVRDILLQVVLLLVLLIVPGKGVGLHGPHAAEVLVGIKGVGLQLDDGHGDVGAVVCHTLVVGQQVVE